MKKVVLSILGLVLILTMAIPADKGFRKNLPGPVKDNDYYDKGVPNQDKVKLGMFLFFDKILSGNKNISCATCHHPLIDSADGLSLSVGEGAKGLGMTRDTGKDENAIHERVPRNAPHVFNLGAEEFTVMFHDGRVAVDSSQPSGFTSPAGDSLPSGLDNVLAVQAMFPVTSGTEMAGQAGENPVGDAAESGDVTLVWELLGQRLRAIDEYVELFKKAFADINSADQITYVHAANAIAAFEAVTWRSDESPFDKYLRGNKRAMSKEAIKGMKLFYGKAKCSKCHSGKFQTDHKFHCIAMPQIGPGKGGDSDRLGDHGRYGVTKDENDKFAFRTPSLRNVVFTAPYGHDGAYSTLRAVVKHHLNAIEAVKNYDESQAILPSRADLDAKDFVVCNDPVRQEEIAQHCELKPKKLKEKHINYLIAFLQSLTGPQAIEARKAIPSYVPSRLPLSD